MRNMSRTWEKCMACLMILCIISTLIPMQVKRVKAESVNSTYYELFKDGMVVATVSDVDALTGDIAYDGYVAVTINETTVDLVAVPNIGYDFMLLNLVDEEGNVGTPLTKDTAKNAEGKTVTPSITEEGGYRYSFEVDSAKTTITDQVTIGTVYSAMPMIKAYFDPSFGMLNATLLNMEPIEKNQSKDDAITSWLGSLTNNKVGTLHTGTEWKWIDDWYGVDCTPQDYVTYYAGDGKVFDITGATAYSRIKYTIDRFVGVLEGSLDNSTFFPIFQTANSNSKAKNSIKRDAVFTGARYPYIRFRALSKLTDISLLRLYGEIVDKSDDSETVAGYQFFKDGVQVGNFDTLEEGLIQGLTYDGYVKTELTDTILKVTAVANEGYDFSILNLMDEVGNVTTPLSKDYVQTGTGKREETNGNYSYTFEVNSLKETATDTAAIGTVYKQIPTIQAFFDSNKELLNSALLDMTPYDKNQSRDNSITCWLNTDTATLNAGGDWWDGLDLANGDYVTYYAGPGKAFCISDIAVYSRRGWSDSRFTAVIEASNDADNYTTIFTTVNSSTSEKYSIKRLAENKDVKYRLIRIKTTGKNTNVNLLKLYGSIEEVADSDLSEEQDKEDTTTFPTITNNTVEILETVSEHGFIHPGVGITKKELENIRKQVIAKNDPWISYYKNLVTSTYASRNFTCNNSNDGETPRNDAYDTQGMKDTAARDGERAFTQALLYVITGDEVYRSNAMRIIRIWEQMDPAKYKYFVDAHIHTGWGLYRMVQAAEILRYTSCQNSELAWTDQDTAKFIANVVDPTVNTFLNYNDKFMNQHNFPLYGTLAAAIFKDDMQEYEEKVEWTTVNSTAPDPYYTGSIYWVYRLMTQNEATKEALDPSDYHVQLIEMGRDLAHAGDDVGTLINLAKIINVQNTKLDPEKGTVSSQQNAVNIYNFLDDRILKATDYFCKFDMGYDVDWTVAQTSIGSEEYPTSYYTIPSDEYRGRLYAAGIAPLYYVYRYELGYSDEQIEKMAPYYMKAFKQKFGPTFYSAGSGENKDVEISTSDGAWLYIPEEVVSDGNLIASNVPEAYTEKNKYTYELERQFSIIDGSNACVESTDKINIGKEGNTSYIATKSSENNTLFAVYNLSLINRKDKAYVGLRIRTDGNAVLEIKKDVNLEPFHILQLPNTHGEWKNIVFDMGYDTVTAGQYPALTYLMYFNVVGNGVKVDFDSININANATLSAPVFNNVTNSVMKIAVASGDEYVFDFSATDTNALHNNNLTYELQGDILEGAVLDQSTGKFSWNPDVNLSGTYNSSIIVSDGASCASVNLQIIVGKNRIDTINRVCEQYNPDREYLSVTVEDYSKALEEAKAITADAQTEAFYEKVTKLLSTMAALEDLNPLLSDGSLDFTKMVYGTSLAQGKLESLVDNNPVTFTADLTMKYFTIDFGAFYRVKASSFSVQPRNIWPARLAGCVIQGSNDGETWDTLTDPSPYSDNLVNLNVIKQYQNNAYRYFRATTLWPITTDKYAARESILSMGEFRIFGIRQEISTKIREVSISSDAVSVPQRTVAGNTVTLNITAKQPLESLRVVISGLDATISKNDDLHYSASVTLTEEAALFNASKNALFNVSYTYLDAQNNNKLTVGEDVTMTTDGSAVFVSSDDKSINPLELNTYFYSSWNNDGVERKTQADIQREIENLWDNNTATNSDARQASGSGSGSYIIIDFGENVGVSLSRVEAIARLDQLSRSTGMYVQGANDYNDITHKGTWKTLTASTLYSSEWQGLNVSDHRYYRYIRFINNGNWFGNMSEIRLYGDVTKDLANAIDSTTLQQAILKAQNLKESNYSEASWKGFKNAYDLACETLKIENVTQEQLDAAFDMLNTAIDKLVKKSDEEESQKPTDTITPSTPKPEPNETPKQEEIYNKVEIKVSALDGSENKNALKIQKLLLKQKVNSESVVSVIIKNIVEPAKVSISLEKYNFKAGQKVYLYVYNKVADVLEEIPNNQKTVSKLKKITISLLEDQEIIIVDKKLSGKGVINLVDKIIVDWKSKTLKKGDTYTIVNKIPNTLAVVTDFTKNSDPLGQEEAKITYQSSNKSVIKVNSLGKITAVKKGKAVVTITIKLENGEKRVVKKAIVVK